MLETYKNHNTNCPATQWEKIDISKVFLNVSLAVLTNICDLVQANIAFIILAVILLIVLFAVYKSFWSHVYYFKELTDTGFQHIGRGAGRDARVARARAARRLGGKLPPPYPNGWFVVAESRELKVGGVMAVDVLGQNLCVYRGADGMARCVDAYCPHLGANMAAGGAVRDNCIECPFHRWKFNGDGHCVSVPGQEKPPKGVSVRSWPVCEADGAVWVWHDAGGAEPRWQVADALQLAHWGYRGRNEFIVSSHVQDIPENGADVAHLNAVHSPSLLTGLADKYPALLNIIGQHVWSGEWTRGEGHTAVMKVQHDYRIGKLSMFNISGDAYQMGPGHVRLQLTTSFGPVLIVLSVTPLSPLEQRVVQRFYSPSYNAPLAALFVRGESYMFERDITVWNSKKYISSPAYVKTDRTIRAFRAWFSQFYDEHSVSFADALKKQQNPLDW